MTDPHILSVLKEVLLRAENAVPHPTRGKARYRLDFSSDSGQARPCDQVGHPFRHRALEKNKNRVGLLY